MSDPATGQNSSDGWKLENPAQCEAWEDGWLGTRTPNQRIKSPMLYHWASYPEYWLILTPNQLLIINRATEVGQPHLWWRLELSLGTLDYRNFFRLWRQRLFVPSAVEVCKRLYKRRSILNFSMSNIIFTSFVLVHEVRVKPNRSRSSIPTAAATASSYSQNFRWHCFVNLV